MKIIISDRVKEKVPEEIVQMIIGMVQEKLQTHDNQIQFIELQTDPSELKLIQIKQNCIQQKEKNNLLLQFPLEKKLEIKRMVILQRKRKTAILSEKEFLHYFLNEVD